MRRLTPFAWSIALVLIACLSYPLVLLLFVPSGFVLDSVEPRVRRTVMLYLLVTVGMFEVGCLGAACVGFMNWIKRILRLARAGGLPQNWCDALRISRIGSPRDLIRPVYVLYFAAVMAFGFSFNESIAVRHLASILIVIGSLACGIVWLRGAHTGVRFCGRLAPSCVSILWLTYGLVTYSMPVNSVLPQALACASVFAAQLCGVYFVSRWCTTVMDLLENLIALNSIQQDHVEAAHA